MSNTTEPKAEPDAYCVSTEDGACISDDPRCMHHRARVGEREAEPMGYMSPESLAKLKQHDVMSLVPVQNWADGEYCIAVYTAPPAESTGSVGFDTGMDVGAGRSVDRNAGAPEVLPTDLRVEAWPMQQGGMKVGLPRGVKITHIPTGHVCACKSERSQHKNRDIALAGIKAMIAAAPKRGEGNP